MKMTFTAAAVAAAMSTAALIAPQVANAQTVLTVDLNTLYRDSVAAKSGDAQLSAKYKDRITTVQNNFQTNYKAYVDQVDAAKKALKPDGTLPQANQDAFEKARNAVAQAQNDADALQQELNAVGQYVRDQIFEKVKPIAEKVRTDRKGLVVLPRVSTVAFDPSTDITPAVLQQLNATMTTVSITPPQPQGAAPAAAPASTTPPKSQPQSR